MAEWLKALVSKTGIPFTGYRGFESPFFRWISAPSVMIIKHLGFFLCKKVAPKMHRLMDGYTMSLEDFTST